MFEEIKNLLVEEMQLDPNDITPDSELVNDLGINSLELADLVLLCEERLGVEIKDDDISKFITVSDVADYIAANRK